MNNTRLAIVLLTALGLALVGVALGLIYMDFRAREGAWVELIHDPALADYERDLLMREWDRNAEAWAALVTGSLGAAACGGAAVLLLMQLRWFQQRDDAC